MLKDATRGQQQALPEGGPTLDGAGLDSGTCTDKPTLARLVAPAATLVIAAAFTLLGMASTMAAKQPVEDDAGKQVFESNCAMCHGDDGHGTDAGKSLGAPDLGSDDVQKLSDDMLFDVISKGQNNMPSFKDDLSADEIRSAISHVRTFAAKK